MTRAAGVAGAKPGGAEQAARSGVSPALTSQLFDLAGEPSDVAFDAMPFGALSLVRHAIVRERDRPPARRCAVFDVKRTPLTGSHEGFLKQGHACSRSETRGPYYPK